LERAPAGTPSVGLLGGHGGGAILTLQVRITPMVDVALDLHGGA
jgi:hypothetical protein